jgi:hypothetical protein
MRQWRISNELYNKPLLHEEVPRVHTTNENLSLTTANVHCGVRTTHQHLTSNRIDNAFIADRSTARCRAGLRRHMRDLGSQRMGWRNATARRCRLRKRCNRCNLKRFCTPRTRAGGCSRRTTCGRADALTGALRLRMRQLYMVLCVRILLVTAAPFAADIWPEIFQYGCTNLLVHLANTPGHTRRTIMRIAELSWTWCLA